MLSEQAAFATGRAVLKLYKVYLLFTMNSCFLMQINTNKK